MNGLNPIEFNNLNGLMEIYADNLNTLTINNLEIDQLYNITVLGAKTKQEREKIIKKAMDNIYNI